MALPDHFVIAWAPVWAEDLAAEDLAAGGHGSVNWAASHRWQVHEAIARELGPNATPAELAAGVAQLTAEARAWGAEREARQGERQRENPDYGGTGWWGAPGEVERKRREAERWRRRAEPDGRGAE